MSIQLFGPFRYNSSSGELTNLDTDSCVTLRHKLNQLLAYLIQNRERVVPKDELLDTLWEQGDFRESSLTQSIGELRRALGDSAQTAKYIKTYQQRGYQWQCALSPPPSENTTASPSSSSHRRLSLSPRRMRIAALLLIAVTSALALFTFTNATLQESFETDDPSIPNILVLPILNDSSDPTHDWVALGLSDMIAVEMQRSGWARITPPAMANMQLLQEELAWPALPAHIRGLMKKHRQDVALLASFRMYSQQQVLDFQILHADGKVQQGSITYPQLPEQTQAIAKQILHLVRPTNAPGTASSAVSPLNSADKSLGWQAIAEGMSALQTSGPRRAMDYFEAARLLTQDEPWVLAYLAQSEILSGEWKRAEQHIQQAQTHNPGDQSLLAFTAYLNAELAFRRGQTETMKQSLALAIHTAQNHNNVQVMVDSYRLAARTAWINQQWHEHQKWTQKANALYPRGGDLRIEAEKLLYLGNPIAIGPEKDPQQDLLLSRERIQTALNFYQQLGNQPAIAASYFALAQNYNIPLNERNQALQQAIEAYIALALPYELAEVYLYAAFHYLQLHNGARSLHYVELAAPLIHAHPQHGLRDALAFYQAFSKMDMGLDQSFKGLHGQNSTILLEAITEFEALVSSADNLIDQANSRVMLGWAYADLHDYSPAIDHLKRAMQLYRQHGMHTTYAYAEYSLMYIYLKQGQYEKVIEQAEQNTDMGIHSPRQLVYLSRAYFELQQYEAAERTLLRLKNTPGYWKTKHDTRLEHYRAAKRQVSSLAHTNGYALFDEEPAHSEYCEQGWVMEAAAPQ